MTHYAVDIEYSFNMAKCDAVKLQKSWKLSNIENVAGHIWVGRSGRFTENNWQKVFDNPKDALQFAIDTLQERQKSHMEEVTRLGDEISNLIATVEKLSIDHPNTSESR